MKHDFLCRYSGKFPGATQHLKRQLYFSGIKYSKRKCVFYFFKAIFDTRLRHTWPFLTRGLRVAKERVIVDTAICKYLTPGIDTFVISRLARERPISKRQLSQIDLSRTSLRLRSAEYALCPELSMLRFCTFHRTISSLVFMWTLNVSNQHYGQLWDSEQSRVTANSLSAKIINPKVNPLIW